MQAKKKNPKTRTTTSAQKKIKKRAFLLNFCEFKTRKKEIKKKTIKKSMQKLMAK